MYVFMRNNKTKKAIKTMMSSICGSLPNDGRLGTDEKRSFSELPLSFSDPNPGSPWLTFG
jgi:hypothetical protein